MVPPVPALIETTRTWAETLRPAVLSTSVRELLDSVAKVVTPTGAPAPDQVVEVGRDAGPGVADDDLDHRLAVSPGVGSLPDRD